jgi:hypothetical protein
MGNWGCKGLHLTQLDHTYTYTCCILNFLGKIVGYYPDIYIGSAAGSIIVIKTMDVVGRWGDMFTFTWYQ